MVRLSSESCAQTDRDAFERWVEEDPANEIEFLRVQAISDNLDRLRALRPPGAPNPDMLANPASIWWTAIPGAAPAPRPTAAPLTRRAVAGLGVAALIGGGAFLATGRGSKAYATALGQQMNVPLGEAGSLQLNTSSRVDLSQSAPPREARLVYGEALFTIGKARAAPFTVRVDDHELRASSGVFDLRSESDLIRILVTEGEVRLRGKARAGGAFDLHLPAGSDARIDVNGPSLHRQSVEELNRSLTWRFGAISLAGEPLSEAVDEFNRYNISKMAVVDPAVGALRIGGYFEANDPVAFARAVELTFGLGTVQRDGVLYFVAKPRAG